MVVYKVLLGLGNLLSIYPSLYGLAHAWNAPTSTQTLSLLFWEIFPHPHPPHSVWCSGCLKWANFNLNTVFTIKHIDIMFTTLRNHPSPTPPHSVWLSGCLIYINTQPFSTRTFSLLFWEILFHPPTTLCMVCLMLKTSKHDSLRPPRPLQIQVIV